MARATTPPRPSGADTALAVLDPRAERLDVGELRTAWTSLDAIAAEWDRLADMLAAEPFLRPGWIDLWWRSFGSGRLEVLSVRRDGRVVAVLPLCRPALRTAAFMAEPFPLTSRPGTLRSPANWHSPCSGPLAADAAAMTALAEALAARQAPLVSLSFSGDGVSGLAEARSGLGRVGYRLLEQQLSPVPIVPIDGDWNAYLAGLDAKRLSNQRRRERRLAELGAVSVEVRDGSEGLPELLDEVLRLEPSGWKLSGGSAIASRPATVGFYTELSRWAAARGALRISLLRCGGRAIACQLGIEDGGVYYLLKGGFDPEFAKHAPARALVRATLEDAFAAGLRCVDFVGGADPWKLEWTSTTRDRVVLHAFAPGARGELERLALTYGRPARAAARRRLRKLLRR